MFAKTGLRQSKSADSAVRIWGILDPSIVCQVFETWIGESLPVSGVVGAERAGGMRTTGYYPASLLASSMGQLTILRPPGP